MRCFPPRFVLLPGLFLAIAFLGPARAGTAEYTERGRTDFDTAMQALNPYGTWSKVDGLWAYTPLDHQAPYTHGRWLYTDYGWYWAGSEPYSWVTEHYGYWKRGADKLWAWYPGPLWLPQIVELRATPTHIGWRSAAVDDEGSFIEAPADRYAKTDEWTFVTRAQFTRPITPAVAATPAQAADLLDDTTDSFHTYTTYRPITRPGPHPADFLTWAGDGGMLAPVIWTGHAVTAPPALVSVITPASTAPAPATVAAAPSGLAASPATNAVSTAAGDGSEVDTRQVHYWTTMSLPSLWTPRPPDAKPDEIYLYRPDFYQDQDGIERRIGLWLDPSTRASLGIRLRDVLAAKQAGAAASPATGAPDTSTRAFRSPFDDSFGGAAATPATTVTPAPTNAAPSGLASPRPLPASTAR